jgi:hypothetical protein
MVASSDGTLNSAQVVPFRHPAAVAIALEPVSFLTLQGASFPGFL